MINGILGPDTAAQPPAQQQHAPPGYGQPGSFAAPPGMGAAGGQAPQQHQDQQQSPALSLNFGENMVSSLLDDDNDVPF